jgi:hypothetical protein
MNKIKSLEKVEKFEDFCELREKQFVLIRGKIEKIIKIETKKFPAFLKTIKPEKGELNFQGNYIIKSTYYFNNKKKILYKEPSEIILKKIKPKDYQNLEKILTNSFYSHSF